MALPNSYVLKPSSIPAYFDAILDAQAPERFSQKFLENLGFTSTNDRLLIGLLKELRFLNSDGAPQERYFEFLDKSIAKKILAQAVKECYSDLYAINKNAHHLVKDDVTNKLRTLYAGKKSNELIDRIARTFTALVEYSDFTTPTSPQSKDAPHKTDKATPPKSTPPEISVTPNTNPSNQNNTSSETNPAKSSFSALLYHINIVLPETRDQSVYDAIFKSLRDHLQ